MKFPLLLLLLVYLCTTIYCQDDNPDPAGGDLGGDQPISDGNGGVINGTTYGEKVRHKGYYVH